MLGAVKVASEVDGLALSRSESNVGFGNSVAMATSGVMLAGQGLSNGYHINVMSMLQSREAPEPVGTLC